MGIKIDSHAILGLPKLAWVASVNLKNPVALSVFHGPSMELGDSWIVEGIWDGDYQAGSFHTSENFFGSGIRVEERLFILFPLWHWWIIYSIAWMMRGFTFRIV